MQSSLPMLHRVLAGLFALLTIIQPVLAGQALYGDVSIRIHGALGNAIFPLAIVVLVVAFLRDRRGSPAVIVAAALLLLTLAQTGLGYVGRETEGAAAWHIPNGVAIFGLAVYQVTLARVAAVTR